MALPPSLIFHLIPARRKIGQASDAASVKTRYDNITLMQKQMFNERWWEVGQVLIVTVRQAHSVYGHPYQYVACRLQHVHAGPSVQVR